MKYENIKKKTVLIEKLFNKSAENLFVVFFNKSLRFLKNQFNQLLYLHGNVSSISTKSNIFSSICVNIHDIIALWNKIIFSKSLDFVPKLTPFETFSQWCILPCHIRKTKCFYSNFKLHANKQYAFISNVGIL